MKLFLSALILFFVLHVQAQSRPMITLTGTVKDAATGTPLSGASIYFSDAKIGTIANIEGKYIVRNLPAGHHLVEVTNVGYTAIVEHIDVLTGSERNFSLIPAVVENRGVTVTGVTSSTSTRNTPTPVTLVRRSQLLETPSTNIIDALAKQPGISQISTGPAISKPVIRGLSYNRVVVINDGVRQEGQQWGDEHGIEIDEASVNRVEILKGAASLMYGSDAIGGVIHFITNVPVAEGTIKGNLFSAVQTNNGQVGLNANLAGNSNGFNWNVYGSSKSAKDYQNKYDGRVFNSRFNERNFGGYLGLNKRWGFSHLILSSFNQNLGLVEGDRDDATGQFIANGGSALERIANREDLDSRTLFTPKQNVQHYKITSDNSIAIGRNRLKVNLGYQNNIRKEFGNPEDPAEEELHFDLKTATYNLQWRLPEARNLETTIGFSGMYQDNTNRGEEAIIPDYSLFDIGGFVFAQKDIRQTTVTGGLRYDKRTIHSRELEEGGQLKFERFTKAFSNVSGSLGASYHPDNKLTVKANVARGYRAPTLSELASNGAHEGTNRYEYGKRDLTSERSWQFDAGFDVDLNHLSLSLSGFYNRIQDYIFYQRLSNLAGGDSIINVGGEDLEAFQYGQNNAQLSGLEISSDLHPHPLDWLHFVNSVSFVRGMFDRDLDNSRNLPTIPATHWVSELKVAFPKAGKSLRNFYVQVEMDKTFKQDRPFFGYNTETPTPGYALLNAGFGGDVSRSGKTLFSLHISANNITDEAYQNHLNRLKYTAVNNVTGRQGVFGMGRNFSVKLNVPLSFNLRKKEEKTGM
jgi:iron complex outermembrane receptor protein